MAAGGFARASRFELFRGFAPPEAETPRFCAVYETDAALAEPPGFSREALSHGPQAWEQHDTLWRLVYRRVPTSDQAFPPRHAG
jgi:hypothetical protein